MKTSAVAFLGGVTLANLANAHYNFPKFVFGGRTSEPWEYVRETTPVGGAYDDDIAWLTPVTDINSPDLRCGRNASILRHPVNTATVNAGDVVGFSAGPYHIPGYDYAFMYHPGFAAAYLSRAPNDDLDAYEGDGDWFKIMSLTEPQAGTIDWTSPQWAPRRDPLRSLWGTFYLDSWNFTIPATTPPGRYLLRFEHTFPNTDLAQFFTNCAHVEILNDGAVGTPGPLVRIPGLYTPGQPNLYFSTYMLALNNNYNISSFVAPEPAVWQG